MQIKLPKFTDFAGQNLYIGLDVHVRSWTVSVYSDDIELKTFTQPPDINKLIGWLKSHYPEAILHVAYEAGFCGFWIQRSLAEQGIDCQVIHPADIPGSDKERKRKTDRIDSRRLSRGLRNKELNAIFVPERWQEADRALLRTRGKLVRDTTTIKNRIKAFLKVNGILLPKQYSNSYWSQSLLNWLRTISFPQTSAREALNTWLEELLFLMQQQAQLQRAIRRLADEPRYQRQIALLSSIPSIGLITGMTFLTEIGDINRFKSIDQLCSYCGLSPNSYSSGDKFRITGISRRGNPLVKSMLIECAWAAIRRDPALLLYYKQLLPRMHANKAIIKVTRKLLNRIRFVLKQQTPYVVGVVA